MDSDSCLQPPWPTLDVYKNGSGELIIDVDVSQIVTEDLDLTTEAGRILIKGKRRECETADGYLIREIRRGSFERTVDIPPEFDTRAAQALTTTACCGLLFREKTRGYLNPPLTKEVQGYECRVQSWRIRSHRFHRSSLKPFNREKNW